MKALARVLLLIIVLSAGYIALQPQYNMAHWTPNQTMRSLGFSYESVLAYEHYLNWFLHWLTGLIVTLLLSPSKFYFPGNRKYRIIAGYFLVATMALVAELLQSALGRGFETADLIFGVTGTTMATVMLVCFQSSKVDSASGSAT